MRAFTIPTVFTAIDKFSGPVDKMTGAMDKMERKVKSVGDGAAKIAKNSAIVGAAIVAPMALLANAALEFEDRMADVAKTTGLAGKPLEDFSNQLLALAPTTRTSIEELQKIAGIGGQFGVASSELFGFTEKVNEFNVALGSDFSGGVEEASKSISVLKNLFKETRNLSIADAITKSGSAINAISAKGVNVPALTDFISRLGQLPDAIKPTIQATTALGSVLIKAGISSEIGARGVGDVLLTAAQNLPAFAKQMGLTNEATKKLINTAPEKFLAQFASSLKSLDAEGLAKKLKALKIGDTGSLKVIGALSTATATLAEYQGITNSAFAKGTSLNDEYNVKNNTTKAMIEKTTNSFEAFSIILGREILPIVNDLTMKLIPIIKGFIEWSQRNKNVISTIMKVAASVAALSFAISGISTIVLLVTKGIMAYNFTLGLLTAANILSSEAIWANTVAMNGFVFGLKAAQVIMNPYVLALTGIVALTAGLYYATRKVSAAQKAANAIQNRALENTIDQRVEVSLLFQALKKATVGSKEYSDILTKIDAMQPGIVKQYNLQAGALDMMAKAEANLTSNILKRAEAEAKAEMIREKMRDYMTSQMQGPSLMDKFYGAILPNFTANDLFNKRQGIAQKEITDFSNYNLPTANPQKANQDSLAQTMQTNNASVDINIKDPNNRTTATTKAPFVQINTTPTGGVQY